MRPRRSPWTVRYAIPDSTAALITSVEATCDMGSAATRCPGPEKCSRSAIWFAIVPVGTYNAASLPVSSAARSWRRWTVGSSPNQSSPTSASAIALRIEADGLVTVSERRSTRKSFMGTEYMDRQRRGSVQEHRLAVDVADLRPIGLDVVQG